MVLAVLFVSIGASNAHADSYTVTFQCTGTCTAPALPVAANNPISFPSPTIDVLWEGQSFNLTVQNGLAGGTYIWDGFLDDYQPFPGNPTYPVTLIFVIFDPNDPSVGAMDQVHTSFEGNVTAEVVDTGTMTVPEPSSVVFMLIGVSMLGLLLASGKRIAKQKEITQSC
jgi:hypothetical protein